MTNHLLKSTKHCRWCGVLYYAHKPYNRDGFCCLMHKQAHYRAYKKYVTTSSPAKRTAADLKVTPKKRKKRK